MPRLSPTEGRIIWAARPDSINSHELPCQTKIYIKNRWYIWINFIELCYFEENAKEKPDRGFQDSTQKQIKKISKVNSFVDQDLLPKKLEHKKWRKKSHKEIDHPIHNHPKSPLSGSDIKQNSSAQLACVYLSLGHLAAKLWTRGGKIYKQKHKIAFDLLFITTTIPKWCLDVLDSVWNSLIFHSFQPVLLAHKNYFSMEITTPMVENAL